MGSRLWTPMVALVLTLGCIQLDAGDGTTTFGNEGGGTLDDGVGTFEGPDDGQDDGLDGGLLGDCFQYIEACEQDPYCVCYLQCVAEYQTTTGCLERCQLATTPYWAEQFLSCLGGVPEIPGQDSGGEEERSE